MHICHVHNTKKSLTRNETSVFSCVLRFASMTELKVDWCLLEQNDWNATVCFCTALIWFLHQILIHCPDAGQWCILMYINEMCSLVVFDPGSWFGLIPYCFMPSSDVWFCSMPESTLGYWLTQQPGEPAWLGQSFHHSVFIFYALWIHSIVFLINQVLCLHVCLGSRAKLPE